MISNTLLLLFRYFFMAPTLLRPRVWVNGDRRARSLATMDALAPFACKGRLTFGLRGLRIAVLSGFCLGRKNEVCCDFRVRRPSLSHLEARTEFRWWRSLDSRIGRNVRTRVHWLDCYSAVTRTTD